MSRTFDSLSTLAIPSDVIILAPDAASIPGDVSLAEGLGSSAKPPSSSAQSLSLVKRINALEITADKRFNVNAELGAGMGVWVSGAAASWPDTSRGSRTSAPASDEHDVASARAAARALARGPPPHEPYAFVPAVTHALPALGVSALTVGDCNARFQSFGFWAAPSGPGGKGAASTLAAARLGILFYVDAGGTVVGVLFWEAAMKPTAVGLGGVDAAGELWAAAAKTGVAVEAPRLLSGADTVGATALAQRLISRTAIEPISGERDTVAGVLAIAARALLCARVGYNAAEQLPIVFYPQWVPPRVHAQRTWALGFGSAATIVAPEWARR